MSASLYANGQAELKTAAALAVQHEKERREAVRVANAEKRAREDAKPTVETPKDAVMVRIRHLRWFKVKRVNKTTVTVVSAVNQHTGAVSLVRYPLADVVAVAR